jgi:hypothetical protein
MSHLSRDKLPFCLAQRAFAALLALSLRCSAVSFCAVAFPPRLPSTKNSRPGLDKLMVNAARRRFDVLVVWRFDRFARSVSHLLRALEQF